MEKELIKYTNNSDAIFRSLSASCAGCSDSQSAFSPSLHLRCHWTHNLSINIPLFCFVPLLFGGSTGCFNMFLYIFLAVQFDFT